MRGKRMPQPPKLTIFLLCPLCYRDPRPGGVWPASQSLAGPPSSATAAGTAPAPARPPLLPPLPGQPPQPPVTPAPRGALRGAAAPPCGGQVRSPAVHGTGRVTGGCPWTRWSQPNWFCCVTAHQCPSHGVLRRERPGLEASIPAVMLRYHTRSQSDQA